MRCSIIANEIFLKLVVVLTFWIHLRVDYLTFASSSVSIDEQQELTSAQWLHEHMPALGFGTAGLQVDTTRATLMALRSGCKMIDTAQAVEWYDEAAVGEAIKLYKSESNNSHIYVVTKIHPRSFEERKMRDRLTQSRSNLFRGSDSSSDVLDAVLLHAPWCWRNHCTEEEERVHWRTGWYNLEQLQDEFMILKLGVSNFDIKLLKELTLSVANRKVAVIQNWMDPFHQDREVREFARSHGIEYQAYSSLGTQWSNSPRMRGQPNPVLNSWVLQDIAVKHNTSVARVVIAWVNAEGGIALPRTRSAEHIEDNFGFLREVDSTGAAAPRSTIESAAIRQVVPLDADDLSRIRSLDGTLGVPWD